MNHLQRNDLCSCGSGKKYKKCCMGRAKNSFSSGIFSVKNKYVYLALIIVFFLSVFLRYYGFHKSHGLTFDEGLYAQLLSPQLQEDPTNYSTQEAYRRLVTQSERPLPKYLDRPLFKHPPLYCYLIAFNYGIFGKSDLAAVSVSILLGSLMILVVFLFGKFLYDERVGLLAAAFLCIEPVHWVCSQRIWMETTLSFFMLLGIFLFALGEKKKHYLAFSGLSIGLAMVTKYPGILSLFIVTSFVILFDRSLLKKRGFWVLCFLAFLVFFPWVIWNWRVYGNLTDAFISAHNLVKHKETALGFLPAHKGLLLILILLIGILSVMWNKIKRFFKARFMDGEMLKGKVGILYFALFVFVLIFIPFLRGIGKEAFIWREAVLVGWSNPFKAGSWHFYLTRLSELSPLYIFSFLSFPFFVGHNRGDKLLILSSLSIVMAFILWGNYQSRYILPAVPFLVILSARWQVWAYDKLSGPKTSQVILKVLLVGISVYFIIKTLKVDSLIAVGSDFGYF